MKLNTIIFFISILFQFSCSNPKQEIPENILNEEQMVALMCDMQLAEATIKLQINRLDSASIHSDSLYEAVFKKHRINKEIFDKNFEYYSLQPSAMEGIYNRVIETLSQNQAGLRGKIQQETEEQ
jgi:hypothetical protein